MRCGTLGASGHVTTKPSIRKWSVLYKSGAYAWKVLCLTPGDLLCARGEVACDRNWLNVEKSRLIAGEKSAEGILVLLKVG
jgi:hypothetical protein